MQTRTFSRESRIESADCWPEQSFHLSEGELRQLGMYQLAYVTAVGSDSGVVNFIVHGADGLAVAVVEEPELAVGLADQLGLALVAVH